MSYQPNRWAIGLIPLAVLWILGTVGAENDIERTLTKDVGDAIRGEVAAPGVRVRGRDVALYGEAFTHADQKSAIDNAWTVSGVRSVRADKLGVIEAVGPYNFWMARDGARVTLSGNVPNRQAKADIAAAAKTVGASDVVDNTTYARGESDALPAAAAYGAKLLGLVTKGAAAYSDGALNVSGVASSAESYGRALALLKTPPQGVQISASAIAPPLASPYVFSAVRNDAGVVLAGDAPSEAAKGALAARAAKAFPGLKIEDRVALASGASDKEPAAADWALTALAKLAAGRAEVRDARHRPPRPGQGAGRPRRRDGGESQGAGGLLGRRACRAGCCRALRFRRHARRGRAASDRLHAGRAGPRDPDGRRKCDRPSRRRPDQDRGGAAEAGAVRRAREIRGCGTRRA